VFGYHTNNMAVVFGYERDEITTTTTSPCRERIEERKTRREITVVC
jgi:hypothetical protein